MSASDSAAHIEVWSGQQVFWPVTRILGFAAHRRLASMTLDQSNFRNFPEKLWRIVHDYRGKQLCEMLRTWCLPREHAFIIMMHHPELTDEQCRFVFSLTSPVKRPSTAGELVLNQDDVAFLTRLKIAA